MPDIAAMLRASRVIAVVGLSDRVDRPSHAVAAYLQEQGYRIIPVNPRLEAPVLGEQPYPDVRSIHEKVDIVDIFRRSEDVPPVVDEAISVGAPLIWLQLGIINDEAARKAESAGVTLVMDRCLKVEHQALLGGGLG